MLDKKDLIFIFLLICLLNIVQKDFVDAEKSEDSRLLHYYSSNSPMYSFPLDSKIES